VKPNPTSMSRPPAITETKTFTDFAQSKLVTKSVPVLDDEGNETGHFQDVLEREFEELTLTFCVQADASVDISLKAKIRDAIADHIDGRNGGPPARFPPVDGEYVVVTTELLVGCIYLESVETPPEGDRKYTLGDWVSLSVTWPTAFQEICAWYNQLETHAGMSSKN
jgi:hypothetical protein